MNVSLAIGMVNAFVLFVLRLALLAIVIILVRSPVPGMIISLGGCVEIESQWDALVCQPPKSPILGDFEIELARKSPRMGDLGGGSGCYLIANP
jgi:hypothetical protein